MTPKGKLESEALRRGFSTVEELVVSALNKRGSVTGAATEIGVFPNALNLWLDRNGYAVVTDTKARLVRKESA